MTPSKVFILALCVVSSACISLPDIDDSLPEPDGGPPIDGGTDQTPPTLVRTTPSHGSTQVPVDSTVELEFSEVMEESSLQLTSVPTVSFTLESWAPESKRAVFRPSAPLAQDQQYMITAEGKDLAGNSLTGTHNFAFTTVGPEPDITPPTLISASPTNGTRGLPRDTKIKLTFSEPMNRASVERAFSFITPEGTALGSTWNTSGTEVEFTPAALLPHGITVSWLLSTEATDLAGNAFDSASALFGIIDLQVHRIGLTTPNSKLASTESIPQYSTWPIGDDSENRPYHGFITFSLDSLVSARVTQILSAKLTWRYVNPGVGPFSTLGRFVVEPVNYGAFTNDTFLTPSVGTPLLLGYQDLGVSSGFTNIPVTAMVVDAWNQRASRWYSAQFRLRFESWTDNDSAPDSLEINPDSLQLQITCEQP